MRNMGLVWGLFLPFVLSFSYAPHFQGPLKNGRSGELYNPFSQKCCHGVTFPLTRNSVLLCCGNTTFDYTEQICCHDSVQPLTFGSRTSCCGHTTFDVKKALCCMGKVRWLSKGFKEEDLQYFECCEADTYDTRTSACCLGQVVKKSSPTAKCCGSSTFDPSKQICCADLIQESLGRNTKCCMEKPYNADTDMCCPYTGEVVGSPWVNASCCGQKAYDEKKQVCCQDQTGNFNLSDRPATLGFREPSCCGAQPYDYLKQACCNDTVYEMHSDFAHGFNSPGMWSSMCCGNQMVNTDTHLCCDAKNPVKKESQFDSCCGEEPYSYQKEICCYAKGIFTKSSKGNGDQPGCCAGKHFDRRTHLCCADQMDWRNLHETLVERKNERTHCCGSEAFDATGHVCCGGKIHPRPAMARDWGCCGQAVFDPMTDECCDLVVKRVKNDAQRGCCSVHMADDFVPGCSGRLPLPEPFPDGGPAEYENEALLSTDE